MKRRIIAAIFAAVLIISIAVPALAYGYLGRGTIVNCNEWVSLRSYASTSASRICKVPRGAKVDVYSYNSEFYKCEYHGKTGYILTSYVDVGHNTFNHYLGIGTVVKCNEWVSLRSSPSTSASRICTVPKGNTVSVYDCGDSKFYKCTYNGHEGYILKEYIRIK